MVYVYIQNDRLQKHADMWMWGIVSQNARASRELGKLVFLSLTGKTVLTQVYNYNIEYGNILECVEFLFTGLAGILVNMPLCKIEIKNKS